MPAPPLASRAVALIAAAILLAGLTMAARTHGAPSITGQKAEVAELGRQVAELDVRVGQAIAAHNEAIDRLEEAQTTLARTRGDLAGARRDLDRAQGLLADRVVALYVTPQPSFVELLMTSGSLNQAQEARELLDRIARGDAGAVAGVRDRRARLEALEARQAEAEAVSRRHLDAAADRKSEVAGLLAERKRVLGDAKAQLTRLVKEEQERKARLAALEAARGAALTSMPYAGTATVAGALPAGDYVFPVVGGARFTNDWLAPRAGGRYHQGIDLFADTGTPLVAVADGTLFNVGYNGLGGWRLWVRDRSGNTFYYAHLSAYTATSTEGASVARGDVIGYVGNTGDAVGTPPHVHFEVHPGGGGPVPPYPIVTGWPQVS